MNIFQKIWVAVIECIGRIHWKPKNILTTEEQDHIRQLLIDNYYIMLSRRNNHMSTYMVSFANFVLTRKFSFWSHAFMNLEDKVNTDDDFLIIEAIGTGVQTTHFSQAFDVNSVVLLKPKCMSMGDWTTVLDKANSELGKPYDNLFDLRNDNALSCVELIRTALKATPNYDKDFPHFEEMIKQNKNLTPQMFYDCKDFEIVLEIRH